LNQQRSTLSQISNNKFGGSEHRSSVQARKRMSDYQESDIHTSQVVHKSKKIQVSQLTVEANDSIISKLDQLELVQAKLKKSQPYAKF
jgi:hypothetical protein